ncbi:MAG: linear amide C-N hydrolase [Spirochaetes bacterium]|nr:linear amide C-N hydrolase [Spirochaetota bacterium]
MNKFLNKISVIFILVILLKPVYPCTTFSIRSDNKLVFGRNFDFSTGYCHITINKRNMVKKSFSLKTEAPLIWISKYGSITFNQVGREFPYGGMNEKGLVIEILWLNETVYPEMDKRYGLMEVQWVEYQLDNSSTVEEVIANDKVIRISRASFSPVHFFICDKNGDTASFEYINGKIVYHRDKDLPYKVLTNNTYKESINYLKGFAGFGGNESMHFTNKSLDRFAVAANMIENYDGKKNIISYSFNILNSIRSRSQTQWSIVYDIGNMKIYYKTKKNQKVRSISFKNFDFSCKASNLYADIEEKPKKGRINFKKYNYMSNFDLINRSCNSINFLKKIPVSTREIFAKYPESIKCGD